MPPGGCTPILWTIAPHSLAGPMCDILLLSDALQFSLLEKEIVWKLVYVRELEFHRDASVHPRPGETELPTCPVCLERLDQNISGVVTTVSFLNSLGSDLGSTCCEFWNMKAMVGMRSVQPFVALCKWTFSLAGHQWLQQQRNVIFVGWMSCISALWALQQMLADQYMSDCGLQDLSWRQCLGCCIFATTQAWNAAVS